LGDALLNAPSSGVYPAADGHVAVVAGASNAVWRRFCEPSAAPISCATPASPRGRPGATAATRSPGSSRAGQAGTRRRCCGAHTKIRTSSGVNTDHLDRIP